MKLKYLATIATASIVTIGGTALFSNSAIAFESSNTATIVADNPCAAVDPCGGAEKVNPCAGEEANPCAGEINPCAGK